MQLAIYRDASGQYYLRVPRSSGVLRWYLHEGCWTSASASLPAGLAEVDVGQLPPGLGEEVLAAAARMEALGEQLWSERN